MSRVTAVRCVGIVAKPSGRHARSTLQRILKVLRRHRVEALVDTDDTPRAGVKPGEARAELVRRADVVIVLGGDGTFLSVARCVGPSGPPLVGINLGTLGFLTEARRSELETAIETVVRGNATVERRLMLSIVVSRDQAGTTRYRALNDVVVTKSALARLVRLRLEVNGRPVNTYRADGLIVATPTGSTAYSLSAGGPLVHPELDAILVTPICPHALANRPLVVPSSARIRITRLSRAEPVYVTVDGQIGGPLEQGDHLEIRRNRFPLRLLRPFPRTFYETLKTKLKWT